MLAVERTSAPSPALVIELEPAARLASMSARWLIDLSPGSTISPRSRVAGVTIAASVEVVAIERASLRA